ncbi:hypothetical protein BXO88_10795 [Oribacterium sp. C9]|uniref:ParA family protein n=1 Tax=Oribacterium sp. C9 TaxID=1943579 RepID=UPI00098FA767|nr:AAA family ATPase [Oribacterium sp. C9]OON85739.1 hypothetical protein BXO88_10795 [Oribacterium sp. C9]
MKRKDNCTTYVLGNRKGGSSKTGSTVSFATILSFAGYSVLVIDADPQSNATQILGCYFDEDKGNDYSDVLLGKCEIQDAIIHSPYGMDVLPNEKKIDRLSDAFMDYKYTHLIPNNINSGTILARELDKIKHLYDYILIDTNPSDSEAGDNALIASDKLIVPVQEEGASNDGLQDELDKVQYVQQNFNPDFEIAGVFLCNIDPRHTNLYKQRRKLLMDSLQDLFMKTWVRSALVYKNSSSFYRPIYFLEKNSKIGTDYINLALELNLITKNDYEMLAKQGYVNKEVKVEIDE